MLKNIIPNNPKQNSYKKTKSILTDEVIEHDSFKFVALVGYVILGLIFFDYLHLIFPPKFLNPNWELEVIGKIIESIWIMLLGFMLVFFRTQKQSIKVGELRVLSVLSWITLLVALGCFLMTPLLISNAIRINQTNKAQINAQITNQNIQVERVLTQIEGASDREIAVLMQRNNLQNLPEGTQNPRKYLASTIQERQQVAKEQLTQSLKSQQLRLFKTTFKWSLAAIISGVTFICVWKTTAWTRSIKI